MDLMRDLLLLHFGNVRYGVWADEVASLRGALPLHHLPLSPPAIAGIAIIENRSAVIADLAACLGLPRLTGPRPGTFLMIDTQDKIAGFCVEGQHEQIECPPELVLSLPSSVATDLADTCAIHDRSLAPIINIRSLHDRLKQGILELPSPDLGQRARPMDLSGVRAIRMFTVNGSRFCVDARCSEYVAFGESGIARLPVQSRRICGVALRDNALVPVVLPGERLAAGTRADGTGMLLVDVQGVRHGIAVDEDLGVVEGPDLKALALPGLAAKPWLPAAVLVNGKPCLLVDAGLFVAQEENSLDQESPPVFTPASPFPGKFLKHDVEVVEFSFLGTRHAVPKDEVKEVHPMLPFIPVPRMPEIVLGVAELRGELLPVLDLAAVFGRRSDTGRNGRMIRIVNGDFHALVVAGEVAGDRMLPVAAQRKVPIALPHHVLYGCYLDAGLVMLILNVEALAVHFEKAAVRELVASLSPEWTEIGAPGKTPLSSVMPDQRFGMEHDGQEEAAPIASQAEAGDAEQESITAVAAAGQELRMEEEARLKSAAEAAGREQARQRIESEMRRAEDEAREERRRHEEAERTRSEAEARGRAEAEEKARDREAARRKAAEDAENRAAEEARTRQIEERERQAADQARMALEAEKQAAEEAEQRATTERAVQRRISPETPKAPMAAQPSAQEISGGRQPEERKRGKYLWVASMIAAVLIVIIYVTGAPIKKIALPIVEKEQPQTVLKPSMPPDEPKQEAPADLPKGFPRPETLAPLYLTVPPDRVVPDQAVYHVVKGDTLWGIAKRFTGNPLNYPRVAKDNSIATPDLIFPGQRIRLVQEKR